MPQDGVDPRSIVVLVHERTAIVDAGNAIPAGACRSAGRMDATPESRFGSFASQQRPPRSCFRAISGNRAPDIHDRPGS
jgi:hypothetical protein